MPNIAVAFRQETMRLARKEATGETRGIHEAAARFRKDIASLKRQVLKLKADVARLERHSRKTTLQSKRNDDGAKVRFSAKSVISQRRRLALSAVDYGRLIGVSGQTINGWEKGTTRPRQAQLAAFASVRNLGRREAVARLEGATGDG